MWFMEISKANCKNCYACIRECPVHAIKVENEQAQIIKERCIVCGECLKRCPQNAKLIKSEKEMVKHYINGKKKVVASVAPSFAAVFGKHSNKLRRALKLLGFDYIEETVSVIDPIIDEYEKYANKPGDDTYIISFCPPINNLIQKYYTDLVKNIIPVSSPSIFHSRVLKEKYGKDTKVVFIGPCLAKKAEGHDENSIDIVLTFEELEKWLKEENINIELLEEDTFDYISKEKRLLPIVGGGAKGIEAGSLKRSIIQVDGIKDCIKILEEVRKGKFKDTLIEMNSCIHNCIDGPGMPHDGVNCYERKEKLKQYAKSCNENNTKECKTISDNISNISVYKDISVYKEFLPQEVLLKQPNSEELSEILNNMGKYDKSDELDCGSCGYNTCREKAVAVYNNMAEINMCLPFMREKAENLTNTIFDITPNIIAIIDKEIEIVQLNPAAEQFFDISSQKSKGLPVAMFLEEDIFKKVKESKINIYKAKTILSQNKATVIQSIIWLEKNQVMLWIANDISRDIELQEKMQNMKIDAINMAQKVINKQMTVAQEIASLLGETTAETKVTLTQLKDLIQVEEVSL